MTIGSTWSPIQWVPKAFYVGKRWPRRDVNRPSPSSVKVPKGWRYT